MGVQLGLIEKCSPGIEFVHVMPDGSIEPCCFKESCCLWNSAARNIIFYTSAKSIKEEWDLMKKPDYDNIKKLEGEIDIMEKKNAVSKGVPVKKRGSWRAEKTADVVKPSKVYRGNELDVEIKCNDRTRLKVPGNVTVASVMRLIDARGRSIISAEMYGEALEVEGVEATDRVTIVPFIPALNDHVSGYDIRTEMVDDGKKEIKKEVKYV